MARLTLIIMALVLSSQVHARTDVADVNGDGGTFVQASPTPTTEPGLVTTGQDAEIGGTSRSVRLAQFCGLDKKGGRHFCADTPKEYMDRCRAAGNSWYVCRSNARKVESKLEVLPSGG